MIHSSQFIYRIRDHVYTLSPGSHVWWQCAYLPTFQNGQTTPTKPTTITAPIITSWAVNRAYIRVLSTHAHWHDYSPIQPLEMSRREKIGTRNVMSWQNRDGWQLWVYLLSPASLKPNSKGLAAYPVDKLTYFLSKLIASRFSSLTNHGQH